MRRIGYLRVSTNKDEQTFSRQEGQLKPLGLDKVYRERVSGSKKSRPQLDAMIEDLQPNDVIYITEVARLSRSTLDLLSIVEEISNKGASIKSLKDAWLDSTTDNPMATFMLTMVGALAQLEREQIVQRVNGGIAVAKAKGVQLGRPTASKNKVDLALQLYDTGEHTTRQITDIAGISKATLYRKLKQRA